MSKDMRISQAIVALQCIQAKHGDVRLYMDINEDVPCTECDGFTHRCYDAFCSSIIATNVDGNIEAHLIATRQ